MLLHHDTIWTGIYIAEEDGHFWLMTSDGDEEYFGTVRPSLAQVDAFRDEIVR